ncbi:MAG: lysophospholipid acyltransferase family protein [Polyangiaceae bacterium]
MDGSPKRTRPRTARTTLGPLAPLLGKAWCKVFGWKVEGGKPPVDKAVLIAAPHTSNWDLPFMLAVAWACETDVSWFGKHTLFEFPFGGIMRWLGGIPVDRRSRHNMVEQAVQTFAERDYLVLAVPPEGTRGKTTRWKTGFYYIASGAKVPIMLGYLDFGRKAGGFGTPFYPTGDIEADFAEFRTYYAKVTAKYPDLACDVALEPAAVARSFAKSPLLN